ncbi:S8 family serine peptidase [Candidatus Peregrinibacteria bacterium]|nr:MAG: S8 family serine peptidase [Candidatus Peregrinibacteria bacterium]
MKLSVNNAVLETIDVLQKYDFIEYAEPNYLIYANSYDPNEKFYSDGQLWGLNNDGSTVIQGDADNSPTYSTNNPGVPESDIQVQEAWNMLSGSESEIIVAVLDTGIDYSHEDLDDVMWVPLDQNGNPDPTACKNRLGGSITCNNHGWNYVDLPPLSNDPMDGHGHGTHVAGIIAAEHSSTDQGVLGLANNVKIMAVKIGNNSGTIIEFVKGIQFAQNNGANIINASYSGTNHSNAEEDAIEAFITSGGLFVAAAGNDHDDIDFFASAYPAAHDLDGISFDDLIAVAATDQQDAIATFSNYGSVSVDIGGPGVNILSTIPNDQYGFKNGTSQATPFVTGVAAMVWGAYPTLTASEVKQIIMQSGDSVPSLAGKTVSGKRLNAYRALVSAKNGAVTLPTIRSISSGGYWTTPSTWEGGVVPSATDSVEINGTVTLTGNTTVAGLHVRPGAILQPTNTNSYPYPEPTLTVTGDIVNEGVIQNYDAGTRKGYLKLVGQEDLENDGTLKPKLVTLTGNLLNWNSIQGSLSVQGNVHNEGSFSAVSYLTLNGTGGAQNPQIISGPSPYNSLIIYGYAQTKGDLICQGGYLTVNSGGTLAIESGTTVSAYGTTNLIGSVFGGSLSLVGSGQSLSLPATIALESLTLSGTGTKTLSSANLATVFTGDFLIESGINFIPNRSTSLPHYQLTVDGLFENHGTVQDNYYQYYNNGKLSLYLLQDLVNTGTLSNTQTYANWPTDPSADSYEFQFTDTGGTWQTPISTTSLFQSIKAYVNESRQWRVRSVVSGIPGAWGNVWGIN